MGEENITEKNIEILRKQLNDKEKKTILEEAKNSTNWIYENIKKICEEWYVKFKRISLKKLEIEIKNLK